MYLSVDSSEMADWLAYDRIEPIGPTPDRQLLAAVLAVTINSNTDRAKTKAVSPDDFMPGFDLVAEANAEANAIARAAVLRLQINEMGAAWEAQQRAKQKADA